MNSVKIQIDYLPVVEYHDQFLQVDCWRISAQDSNFSWVAEFLHTRKKYIILKLNLMILLIDFYVLDYLSILLI